MNAMKCISWKACLYEFASTLLGWYLSDFQKVVYRMKNKYMEETCNVI